MFGAALVVVGAGPSVTSVPSVPSVPFAQQADPEGTTPQIFRRFAGQVVKLQVVEISSAAKAVTGSGFMVSPAGHLVTNYHVVAQYVHEPDRYRVELLDSLGGVQPVQVLAVDAVHDLAVVHAGRASRVWFTLAGETPPQGQRLYALGHPGDLGIAIVEGTYNGRLPHTLYPRIHFTGSLNPGMSGGPTVTPDGRVVGVNVATAGNQQSFLVPADDAAALLRVAQAGAARPPDSLLADVARQLLDYQDRYVRLLFADSTPTVRLGHWAVPTRPAAFFNCWGDADRDEDLPYTVVSHTCATGDDVFLSATQSSGTVEVEHELLTAEDLNRFQFYALYTRRFQALTDDWELFAEPDDDVTGYRCRSGTTRRRGLTAATVFCARRYTKLDGLYDVVVRAALLGRPRQGLLTTLTLSGVSFANAQALARRYLEALAWSE